MISEIRVKARAKSADEAKREIEAVLMAANSVAYLEGLAGSSAAADNNFSEVYGNDPWNGFGLSWEGRMAYKFEATENPGGGLKEYGYQVFRTDGPAQDEAEEFEPEDVSESVIVVGRTYEVTRDHSWDVLYEPQSSEEALDMLTGLSYVRDVKTERRLFGQDPMPKWWVQASIAYEGTPPDRVNGWEEERDESLLAAARRLLKKCSALGAPAESEGLLAPVARAAKPTADELARFGQLAGDSAVDEIEFGRAKSRDGWEIEVGYAVPVTAGGGSAATGRASMAVGGRRVVFGETFDAVLNNVAAELEEAKASARSGTVILKG